MKKQLAIAAAVAVLTSGVAVAVPAQATQGDSRPCVTEREYKAVKKGMLKKRTQRILDGKGTKVTKRVREYEMCGEDGQTVRVKFKKRYHKGWNRVASKRIIDNSPAVNPVPASAAVFDTIPQQLPENLPSLGFEATSTSAFGDLIRLADGGRVFETATVTMSSWACEEGSWNDGTCETMPGATFEHPLTFTVFEVGTDGVVGDEITSLTDDFEIPFRPSTSDVCEAEGKSGWGQSCSNGIAHNVTFDFSGMGVVLPDEFVYAISYNTKSYGTQPIGEVGPWSSLNVALNTDPSTPSVGTDADPDVVYWDSTYNGRAPGLTTDSDWTGYTPAVQIVAKQSK